MDWQTGFSYAVGTGREIRTGEINPFDVETSLDNLLNVLIKKEKGLIVPKFIGVYQTGDMITHTNHLEEQKTLGRERVALAALEQVLNSAADQHILMRLSTTDNAHPNLIFVAYDPELWTHSLVRESLGNNINRITIAPYTELPKFSGKDITIAEQILTKGKRIYDELKDDTAVLKGVTPELRAFQDQAMLYGLTRQEYAVLGILKAPLENSNSIVSGRALIEAMKSINPDKLRT